MRPLNKVKFNWSSKLAYAIGLITTDGSLSKDGRHIYFTSKDLELAELFKRSLGLNNKIGLKGSGSTKGKIYYTVQFGDVIFYNFLLKLGLTPRKTHTLGAINVPDKYFFDFLRGHYDGDGTFYSYFDRRWKNSFMFYLVFLSASEAHILWLRKKLFEQLGVNGHINRSGKHNCFQLKYAKGETQVILRKLYPRSHYPSLSRKHLKIVEALTLASKRI